MQDKIILEKVCISDSKDVATSYVSFDKKKHKCDWNMYATNHKISKQLNIIINSNCSYLITIKLQYTIN